MTDTGNEKIPTQGRPNNTGEGAKDTRQKSSGFWHILSGIVAVLALILAGVNTWWLHFRDFDDLSIGVLGFDLIVTGDRRITAVLDFSVANSGTRPAIVNVMRLTVDPPGDAFNQYLSYWRKELGGSTDVEPILIKSGDLIKRRVYFDFDTAVLEQPQSGYTLATLYVETVNGEGYPFSREIDGFGIAITGGKVGGWKRPTERKHVLLPKPSSDTSKLEPLHLQPK